ncbi:MAG: hypothetical protein WC485_09255, partial [Opitutaceae bacterium]
MPEDSAYAAANQYRMTGAAAHAETAARRRVSTQSMTPWQRMMQVFKKSGQAPADEAAAHDPASALFDILNDWICGLDATGRVTF